jgi:hypothetical protein
MAGQPRQAGCRTMVLITFLVLNHLSKTSERRDKEKSYRFTNKDYLPNDIEKWALINTGDGTLDFLFPSLWSDRKNWNVGEKGVLKDG